jgi:hypothetical protein
MTLPTRLSKLLTKLEPLIVDDAKAAHTERLNRESAQLERKLDRRHTLERFHLSPRPEIRRALIEGTPLPLATTSTRAVGRWLGRSDVPPWLILRGITGCSKTTAAMWALCNGPKPVMWLDATRADQIFAASFGDEVREQQAALQCALLVIDDLGTEQNCARFGGQLVRLMQYRQDLNRRTIVTMNMASAFDEVYPDERIESRLQHIAAIVDDKGPDLRRRTQEPERTGKAKERRR